MFHILLSSLNCQKVVIMITWRSVSSVACTDNPYQATDFQLGLTLARLFAQKYANKSFRSRSNFE